MDNLIGGNPGMKSPGLAIDPNSLEDVKCEFCKTDIFEQKLKLHRLSALLSPTGEEAYIPEPVLVCANCGKEVLKSEE